MEKLSGDKTARVLRCLVEGNSIASTVRITGTAKMTVLRILKECGEACSAYHDEHMRNLPCKQLQLDEVWSFVGCKENNKSKVARACVGDVWMWAAIDPETKLMPSWYLGDRGGQSAYAFCWDLKDRFAGRIQITTDGWQAYEWAIRGTFGDRADYAQMVKIYEKTPSGRNYVTGIEKRVVQGNPDMSKVCTSYVERSNLTLRMNNARFSRLTNCYSKKIENHAHMVAIGLFDYNFCRKHGSLKGATPCMAAGVSDHAWSMDEIVQMVRQYHSQKLASEYEAAFEAHYQHQRNGRVVVNAVRHNPPPLKMKLTPWYHDPESGGANPAVKKEGIEYDLSQPMEN